MFFPHTVTYNKVCTKLKYNNEYVCNTQLYNIWNQMN